MHMIVQRASGLQRQDARLVLRPALLAPVRRRRARRDEPPPALGDGSLLGFADRAARVEDADADGLPLDRAQERERGPERRGAVAGYAEQAESSDGRVVLD